jgi:hypothetical protein
MRALPAVVLWALLCPAAALAQTAPAPATPGPAASAAAAPHRGGDITREQYVERAKRAAERRFERMDADHNGVLTQQERRAWREAHHRRRRGTPPPK